MRKLGVGARCALGVLALILLTGCASREAEKEFAGWAEEHPLDKAEVVGVNARRQSDNGFPIDMVSLTVSARIEEPSREGLLRTYEQLCAYKPSNGNVDVDFTLDVDRLVRAPLPCDDAGADRVADMWHASRSANAVKAIDFGSIRGVEVRPVADRPLRTVIDQSVAVVTAGAHTESGLVYPLSPSLTVWVDPLLDPDGVELQRILDVTDAVTALGPVGEITIRADQGFKAPSGGVYVSLSCDAAFLATPLEEKFDPAWLRFGIHEHHSDPEVAGCGEGDR